MILFLAKERLSTRKRLIMGINKMGIDLKKDVYRSKTQRSNIDRSAQNRTHYLFKNFNRKEI